MRLGAHPELTCIGVWHKACTRWALIVLTSGLGLSSMWVLRWEAERTGWLWAKAMAIQDHLFCSGDQPGH